MRRFTTFMMFVCILWFVAATSGSLSVIIASTVITLVVLPIWSCIISKKTGRDPWNWAFISILLPLIGPLILAIIARKDIAAMNYKEANEGKKGFWQKHFGTYGELIPYAALLIVLIFAVFLKSDPKIPILESLSQKQRDIPSKSEPVEYFPDVNSMNSEPDIPDAIIPPELPQLPDINGFNNGSDVPDALIPPDPPQIPEIIGFNDKPEQSDEFTNPDIPPLPSISPDMFQSEPPSLDPDAFSRPGNIFGNEGIQAWPEYLPKDIPPLPANIYWVWDDSDFVRILFNELPLQELYGYLETMKKEGFSLEYIVYEQAGVVLSEKELKKIVERGDFDAVRLKKEKYNFYIEYGGDEGSYDINVKDF